MLVKKETKIILRSRLLLVVLLVYPLVLVGIIGFAFSAPNQRVPLAVVNEDLDPDGRPHVATIPNPIAGEPSTATVSTSEITLALQPFADVRNVDLETARHLLLTGEVQAIVHFPKNFTERIVSYQTSSSVEITTDQSDPVRAKFMEVLIRGVVQEFQERIVREKVRIVVQTIDDSLDPNLQPGHALYPGFRKLRDNLQQFKETHPNDPGEQQRKVNESIRFVDTIIVTLANSRGLVDSVAQPVQIDLQQERSGTLFIRDLIVPAALGLGIFWTGSLATSSLVVYERESAAYTRLRITPATAWGIYGSKIVVTVAIILAQSLVILAAALIAWDTRIDNVPLTFVVVVLSTFASMGLGMFLAGLSRDVTGSVLLSVLITFPMLFLAGLFYPVSFMPKGAQVLAGFFPLTYTVSALRGAMLRGFDFAVAAPQLIALALFGVGLTAIGIVLSKRLEARR